MSTNELKRQVVQRYETYEMHAKREEHRTIEALLAVIIIGIIVGIKTEKYLVGKKETKK